MLPQTAPDEEGGPRADSTECESASQPPRRIPRYVLPETVIFAVIGSLDLFSTMYLIATNKAVEANPIMASVLDAYGVWGFAIAKGLMLGIPLAGAEWARKTHPVFVKWALRAGIAGYLAIYIFGSIQYNLHVHLF